MPTTKLTGSKGDWTIDIDAKKGKRDEITIKFKPKKPTPPDKGCKKIVFVQTVSPQAFNAAGKRLPYKGEKDFYADPTKYPYGHKDDDTIEEDGESIRVDHLACEGDPFYNGDDKPHDNGGKQGDSTTDPTKEAEMSDPPSENFVGFHAAIAKYVLKFEVCAICAETGAILGCITWTMTATKADPGDIVVDSKAKDNPDGSKGFKKALKKFVDNHTRKKNGKVSWFCPDVGGGVRGPANGDGGGADDSFGGETPGGFLEMWRSGEPTKTRPLDGVKPGTQKGRMFDKVDRVLDHALADIGRVAVTLSWAGKQIKTVSSVTLTSCAEIAPGDLRSIGADDPALINDMSAHTAFIVDPEIMVGILESLRLFAPSLERGEGPALITARTGLCTPDATAFRGALQPPEVQALARLLRCSIDMDRELVRALGFVALNMGFVPDLDLRRSLGEGGSGGGSTPPEPTGERQLADIEGIDKAMEERLTEAGIARLSELADIDPTQVQVRGVSAMRLAAWSAMAGLLLAYPQFDGNDAELLVKGLQVTGPQDLALRAASLNEGMLVDARKRVKLPQTYDTQRLLRYLQQR